MALPVQVSPQSNFSGVNARIFIQIPDVFFQTNQKKKDDTHSLENVWLFLAYFFLQCNLDVSRDQPPAIWSWKNYKPFQVHDLLQHLRGWGTPHPTKLHMSRLGKKGLQLPSDFGNGWISL